MSKTYTFEGWLHLRNYPRGEDGEECIFLDEDGDIYDLRAEYSLLEKIEDTAHPHGRMVFVRWWSSDHKLTKEKLSEEATRELLGEADLDFGARYSEVTGYLWTDNEFKIGGHDLNAELGSLEGKWVCLEIEVRV